MSLFNFGKHSNERQLISHLRTGSPDHAQLQALAALLSDQARRQDLPMDLLCKAEALAEKALSQSHGADSERDRLLQLIHRGALGEVQMRSMHGL